MEQMAEYRTWLPPRAPGRLLPLLRAGEVRESLVLSRLPIAAAQMQRRKGEQGGGGGVDHESRLRSSDITEMMAQLELPRNLSPRQQKAEARGGLSVA